jgi:hypothetical protein
MVDRRAIKSSRCESDAAAISCQKSPEIRTLVSGRLIAVTAVLTAGLFALTTLKPLRAAAQNPRLEERVAEVQRAAVTSEEALASYSWQEQQTISVNGEVKKQTLFLVQIGPDGKQLKTEVDSGSEGRRHSLIRRIVEYEDYANQIAALAQAYVHPNPERLQLLFQRGNIALGSAGFQGEFQLVVQNYLKPGDSMTLLFNFKRKALVSVQVSSYLGDPRDAATISAQFAQLPGGPNHVASMLINGASKQLTVAVQNADYQKM